MRKVRGWTSGRCRDRWNDWMYGCRAGVIRVCRQERQGGQAGIRGHVSSREHIRCVQLSFVGTSSGRLPRSHLLPELLPLPCRPHASLCFGLILTALPLPEGTSIDLFISLTPLNSCGAGFGLFGSLHVPSFPKCTRHRALSNSVDGMSGWALPLL